MESIETLAEALGQELLKYQKTVATVESCTGGGVAQAITGIPGSSAWFGYGFVTYANDAKMELVGVNSDTLNEVWCCEQSSCR